MDKNETQPEFLTEEMILESESLVQAIINAPQSAPMTLEEFLAWMDTI